MADWAEPYRRFWEESFDRLEAYLLELQTKEITYARTRKARGRKRSRP